jgi:hypothetical protein
MNFEGWGKSSWTLIATMFQFLLIFPFRDVTIMERLMSNIQDIRARPLVLTTIALTRVNFHIYVYCVI